MYGGGVAARAEAAAAAVAPAAIDDEEAMRGEEVDGDDDDDDDCWPMPAPAPVAPAIAVVVVVRDISWGRSSSSGGRRGAVQSSFRRRGCFQDLRRGERGCDIPSFFPDARPSYSLGGVYAKRLSPASRGSLPFAGLPLQSFPPLPFT